MEGIDDRGYLRGNPNIPQLISRQVAEQKIFNKHRKYFAKPFAVENYIVHHINTEKLDNSVKNLFICTQEEHSRIHSHQKENRKKFKTKKRLLMFLGHLKGYSSEELKTAEQIIAVISEKTGESVKKITKKVEKKCKRLGRLISKEGAATVVAAEYGINF